MEEMRGGMPIRLDNPRVWRTYLGGSRLDRLHGKKEGADGHFPEEWIMSVVAARNAGREGYKEGMSHLYGTDRTLKAFLEKDPERYLGVSKGDGDGLWGDFSLGVLVKLIDSAERLTLQVHPDRQAAMELFRSPYGKTECWHILGGQPVDGEDPCIYLGFRPGVTRQHWEHLFDIQDIPGMLEAMQKFYVHPGDTILIPGGMPHAIGAGCFLAEIQEPTDLTIRVERTTPSGFPVDDLMCHQGLGFARMFDAFHYEEQSREEIRESCFIQAVPVLETEGGKIVTHIGYGSTPLFRLDEIWVEHELTLPQEMAFSGLYVLEGAGRISAEKGTVPLEKTAQFFVPAGSGALKVRAEGGKPLRILHFWGPCKEGEAVRTGEVQP